ncbi:MAG: hypothetical protein R3E10_11465 [Gemmatimonadota bacterium]
MTQRPMLALAALITGDVLLVLIHLLVFSRDEPSQLLSALFGLDREANLPTWYSSTQLLLAGVCLLWAGTRANRTEGRPSRLLLLAGATFVFLSADEASSIHESITYVLRRFDELPRFQGDHGMWIPLYGMLGAVGLLAGRPLLGWIAREHRRAGGYLLAGALSFCGGAVVLEIISYGWLRTHEAARLYSLEVAAEEGLELLGASLLLFGCRQLASPRPCDESAGPVGGPPPVAGHR